jgi:hypothetical protein
MAQVKTTPVTPMVMVKMPRMRLILLLVEKSRRKNVVGASEGQQG